ncbi:MAG: Gfo/Idh/MocA family oxidoreductase [Bacteroidetes bacterium]|nr:Gfo/Idh/MocA family oxidoreductase [Bacteroidota bacterium]
MLKIGVLGAGHLGKIHIKCLKQIPDYQIVGFYDPDESIADAVQKEFGIPHFNVMDDLIAQSEVIDIVTPTIAHFECAGKALKKARHVFIEKPIVTTPAEARELISIAQEANVKVQVGHVERFNPAFMAAQAYLAQPLFIETHRLALFNPRGTDVPVVLDLMIHDIDIVLSVVRSNVKKISASGVAVVSDTHDICNARLEFENGCVANLTASRISMKNMRKSRFFQRNAYISVDFLDKKVEIIRIKEVDPAQADPLAMIIDLGNGKGSRQIMVDNPEIKPLNAIQTELEGFARAIQTDSTPPVTIMDGYLALDVAYRILEKLG